MNANIDWTVDKAANQLTVSSPRGTMLINWITDDACRVRFADDGRFSPSALIRYGFLKDDWPKVDFNVKEAKGEVVAESGSLRITIAAGSPTLTFSDTDGKILLREAAPPQGSHDGEFKACFALPKDTAFFGLGDQTRDRIDLRGTRATMWIENVIRYIPVPFLMTDKGFGLMVNTTRRIDFDLGADDAGRFGFGGRHASLDYYFFKGGSLPELIDAYTALSGRPPIPPRWSFGLRYICHKHLNAHEVLSDCRSFRKEDFPCDSYGLEPGWMEKDYDYTVDKKWHPDRFFMPSWKSKEQINFLEASRNLGFKPGLWLCINYDLSFEEERRLKKTAQAKARGKADGHLDQAIEQDEHLARGNDWMDKVTKPEEPWYEHLRKFIDQGVETFLLDAADQTYGHPDRLYGNGMRDDEMHNLYPLLLSRQMSEGFRQQTGRRAANMTPNGWIGVQRFPGTWTGDTGGGTKPLVGCLNLGLSGHTYASCDMDNTRPEGIHFGFLLPWCQLNSWAYWKQPWFLTPKNQAIFRYYAKLRCRLLPYLYAMAFKAHQTGLPIMRALPLMFPADRQCRQVLNEYMLGDALLVTAFDKKTYLPEGRWIDYWTGEEHQGPKEFEHTPPDNRGGGLFIKAGAVIPMGPDMAHASELPDTGILLDIFPSGDAELILYEDDGISHDYEDGAFATTRIAVACKRGTMELTIGKREGSYKDMPETRVYSARIRAARKPVSVLLNGKPLRPTRGGEGLPADQPAWRYDAGTSELWIGAAAPSGTIKIVNAKS